VVFVEGADLADTSAVFEDELEPVFGLPGNLTFEGDVRAPRLEWVAAQCEAGRVRDLDVFPDVGGLVDVGDAVVLSAPHQLVILMGRRRPAHRQRRQRKGQVRIGVARRP
jgi:hypothetical protein